METVKIVINSVEDAKNGVKIVETATVENIEETKNITFAILEKGMASGRSSLMVILVDKDGKHLTGQFTQGHLEALVGALKGAKQRFGED